MHSLKLILTNIKYFSVVWIFSSLNIMVGTWVLYIPYVKKSLMLNDAQIGFALFCLALGILLFLALVPYLSKKLGLGRLSCFAIILFAIAFMFPLLAPSYIALCTALFIVGIFSGITDVAMNALIAEIEKEDGVNIMSAAHGFFSLGGVIGATLGSLLMPVFKVPMYHLVAISLVVIVVNILLARHYFSISEEVDSKEKHGYSLKILYPLTAVAFIAFVIMASEGAIEHWSSLYFIEVVKITQQNLAGMGFIVFSVMMTLGRFFGDGISAKIGSLKIILLGCALASIGYVCVLFSQVIITSVGFGIIGLGLSVIIPELFRMAGHTKGIKASVGISFVSGVGFVGFLLGPVILGYISNSYNLKISFLTLLILTLFTLFIATLKFIKKKNFE